MTEIIFERQIINRRAFTLRFKSYVIDWFEANDRDYRKTANYFGVKRETVYQWVANEETIRKLLITSGNGVGKRYRKFRQRKAKYPAIDSMVMQSISKSGINRNVITCSMVINKAKEVLANESLDCRAFKASRSWAKNFMIRNKLGRN